MGSEIGNKGLLRTLGKILGVNDPKQAPRRLNTDEVIVTTDLLQGGFSSYTVQPFTGGKNLAGLTTQQIVVIGPNNSAGPFFGSHLVNDDLETFVLAGRIQGTVVAADLATFVAADAYLTARWLLREPISGITTILTGISRQAIRGALTDDIFQYPLYGGTIAANTKDLVSSSNQTPGDVGFPGIGHPLWVPAGMELLVVFGNEALINFTGLSNLAYEIICVTVPRGSKPPGI